MDFFTFLLWFLLVGSLLWSVLLLLIGISKLLGDKQNSDENSKESECKTPSITTVLYQLLLLLLCLISSICLVYTIYFSLFVFLINVAPVLNFIVVALVIQLSWLLYEGVTHRPNRLSIASPTWSRVSETIIREKSLTGIQITPDIFLVPYSPWCVTATTRKKNNVEIEVSYHLVKGTPPAYLEQFILSEIIRSNLPLSRIHNLLRIAVSCIEYILGKNLLKAIPRVFDPSFWVLMIQMKFSRKLVADIEAKIYNIVRQKLTIKYSEADLDLARDFVKLRQISFEKNIAQLLRSQCEVHTIRDKIYSYHALNGGISTIHYSVIRSANEDDLDMIEGKISLLLQEELLKRQSNLKAFRGVPYFTSFAMEMSGQGKTNV